MKNTMSIVVPTYLGDDLIKRFLESMSLCKLPTSLVDIVVVENGPKQNAENIVLEFEPKLPVKYFYSQEAGLSNARNVGLANTKADIIVFFDNDMKFNENSLTAYEEVFHEYGDNCFYGGPVAADYEVPPPKWLHQYLPWSAKGHSLGSKVIEIDKPLFLGGNHAVSKKAFQEVGMYDEMCATGDLGLMGEETRLQLRLMEAGYKGIYAPDAVVHHWIPSDRCDEKWTIQRQYRAGLTQGAELVTTLPEKYCALFGIPCYLVKEYSLCYLSFIAAKVKRLPKKELFPIRYNLAYLKGQITSIRQSK